MAEPTDWIGGQLTSQAVPPDEHRWIERCGCTATYRALRDGIRALYRAHFPLTAAARADRRAQPGRVHGLAARPRAARRARRARVDAGAGARGRPARRAPPPRAGGGADRRRPRRGRDAARPRRRADRLGGLVPRRDGDRPAAAARRRRARDRVRIRPPHRRAARPGRRPAGQPPAGHGLLRARPPRRRGSHDRPPGRLRALRGALQLGRAGPADAAPGRAAARAEPGRGPADHRARLRRPRARQGPLALPPDRRARPVRARHVPRATSRS